MLRRFHLVFVAAVLTYAPGIIPLAAQGVEKAVPPATDQDGMSRLLPEGTFLYAQVPSLDHTEAAIKRLVATIDEEEAAAVDLLDFPLRALRGVDLQIDRTRPCAVALAAPPATQEEPLSVFLLPVTDPEGVAARIAAKLPGTRPEVSGSYLGLCPGSGYQPSEGSAGLARGRLQGDIALRLDVPRMLERYRPMIHHVLDGGWLEGAPEMVEAMAPLRPMVESLKRQLEATSRVELAATAKDTLVSLELILEGKSGDPWPLSRVFSRTDLRSLAGCLPRDYPLAVALGLNPNSLMDWATSMVQTSTGMYSEEQQKLLTRLLEQSSTFTSLMGAGLAMGMDFKPGDFEIVEVFESKDGPAYIKEVRRMLAAEDLSALGIHLSLWSETQVGQTVVHEARLKLDMSRYPFPAEANLPPDFESQKIADLLLGEEGLRVRMAAVGDKVVFLGGGNDALLQKVLAAAGTKGAPMPPGLAASFRKPGESPAMVVRLDLRAFLAASLEMARTLVPLENAPACPAGDPIPVTLHVVSGERGLQAGLSFDLGAAARLLAGLRSGS